MFLSATPLEKIEQARQKMIIKKLDHYTIIVKNLEKTLFFYENILGFKRLNTVDCKDHILRYFSIPGGQRLELNEYQYKVNNNAVCTAVFS